MTKTSREYTWPVVSDDPLEEGLRILARIILKKIIEQRRSKANEHDPAPVTG
jgi:hypothetical protein